MSSSLEAARLDKTQRWKPPVSAQCALIVEQEPKVGGACVQYGTISSKTLRETALTLTAFSDAAGTFISQP